MAENPVDVFRVLVLQYSPIQFLINRSQCSSSVFISSVEPRDMVSRWLTEDLVIGEMSIPLFDLDKFLQECFRVQTPEDAHLALIRTWDSFTPVVQRLCIDGGLVEGAPVGFRVTSTTIMGDMKAPDFSLIPLTVQPHLSNKGVIAVTLPQDERMGYLLDLDILFTESLLKGAQ